MKYTDTTTMPFGKYKGRELANVPADYLMFLYRGGLNHAQLERYIEENKDVLEAEERDIMNLKKRLSVYMRK